MNAADNNGKTALHWAAAVNNYEAADILIKCGANRDIQDNKVSHAPALLSFPPPPVLSFLRLYLPLFNSLPPSLSLHLPPSLACL